MSVGQIIAGRYEVFRTLGRGGMGEVFAAYDLQLERKVALKAIRPEFRLDPASRARFLREARALSKLEHASICRIHDYVEGDEQDHLVLELIEGTSLRDLMTDGLERAEALRFGEQIGDALAVAHAEGLVHRDLKPGNVMVTADGDAKILDFGLARSAVQTSASAPTPDSRPAGASDVDETSDLTSTLGAADDDTLDRTVTSFESPTPTSPDSVTVVGHAVGTPRYMSPEQARGEEVGSASDMFSFGLLLHEMFTGKRAYTAGMADGLMEDISTGRTEKVRGLDRHLTDLIEQLKSAAASRRPTAVDVTERLRWIRDKPKRRLRRLIAAAVVVVAIGAGVKYTLDLRRERAAADFRRSQSDEHIEFMVEELYAKLEPVGRLDILEDVGVKALDYFETLDESETTPEDQARLGRTWTQIGNVRLSAGDHDAAKAAFESSLGIHQKLVELDPARGKWWMGLSAAHFGVASIAWVEDDLAKATEHFDAYMEVARSLVALEPDNPAYQLELGYALTNMAALHEALGEPERSRDELLQAAAVKRKLVDAEPDNRDYTVSLAVTLSWLAAITRDLGDAEAALESAQGALELRRTLAADESNAEAQQHLSISLQQTGILLDVNDLTEEAEAALREDVSISLRLTRLDPDNTVWQSGVATSWTTLGRFYLDHDRLEDARPPLENGVRELTRLLEIEPDQREWRVQFGKSRRALAMLELRQGRAREALRMLEEGRGSTDPEERSLDLQLRAEIERALSKTGL